MNPGKSLGQAGEDFAWALDMVPVEVEGEPATGTQAVRPPFAGQGQPSRSAPANSKLIGRPHQPPSARSRSLPGAQIHAFRAAFVYDETASPTSTRKIGGTSSALKPTRRNARSQGQPLLEIFSPELLASQQEYLVALKPRGADLRKHPPLGRRFG